MAMNLSVCAWSFEALPLDGALGVCEALGFGGVAVSAFKDRGESSFDPDELGTNPERFSAELRRLIDKRGQHVVDVFVQFAAAFTGRSMNEPDPAARRKNLEMLKGITRFAADVHIPVITVLPGMDHIGVPRDQNFRTAAETLRAAVEIVGEKGVTLCFEPHMQSLTDSPERTLELLEMVPGLRVTLDYSHFVLQYIELERIHKLLPHTGHVHIRPARFGKLQTRHAEGTIDFVDIIGRLKAIGYTGSLALEYVCGAWFDVNQLDTITETLATKRALEPYVPVA